MFKDLDMMLESREGPYAYDIVNSNLIINYVREKDNGQQGIPNPRAVLSHKISQHKITEWFELHKAIPIREHPIAITPEDLSFKPPRKRHYYAIRNQEYWKECGDLGVVREHFRKKVEILESKQEHIF